MVHKALRRCFLLIFLCSRATPRNRGSSSRSSIGVPSCSCCSDRYVPPSGGTSPFRVTTWNVGIWRIRPTRVSWVVRLVARRRRKGNDAQCTSCLFLVDLTYAWRFLVKLSALGLCSCLFSVRLFVSPCGVRHCVQSTTGCDVL